MDDESVWWATWAAALRRARWRPRHRARALALLAWIADEQQRRGAPATYRELARRLATPLGSVNYYLSRLHRAGLLAAEYGRCRTLQLSAAGRQLAQGWPAFGLPVIYGRRVDGEGTANGGA